MEDYGDIIFYLIVAAVGIIGAVFNNKKKRAGFPPPQPVDIDEQQEVEYDHNGERQEMSYPADEMPEATTQYQTIDEQSMETRASDIANEAHKASEAEALKRMMEYKDSYSQTESEIFKAEGWAIENDEPITDIEQDPDIIALEEQEGSWASQLADEFDLPKAIVYSEILKRKDFV
ncbi:MAG: hypothetical protein U5K32_04395 [Bacteroidales bacterium]|nr:hypothetical protein [Bacteroidales bacterium]